MPHRTTSASVLDDLDLAFADATALFNEPTREALPTSWPTLVDLSHLPEVIARVVATAPPLSSEHCEELAVLLR